MTRFSSIFDHTSHVFRKYLRPRTNKNELVVEMLVMQQNHSFCHVFFTSQPSPTKSQTTQLQEKSVQKSTFCGASIKLRFGSVLASEHSPQTVPSSTQNRKKIDEKSPQEAKLRNRNQNFAKMPFKTLAEPQLGRVQGPERLQHRNKHILLYSLRGGDSALPPAPTPRAGNPLG